MSLINKVGITGVMSNWDEYATDEASEHLESQTTQYTVPEILEMIREIKRSFDPSILERMMLLLDEHLHNTNNPHKTDLDSMGTSVVAELYNEWTKLGYTGSVEDFIRVLFQYIEIADSETTIEGTSTSKLVSVKGAKDMYTYHLTDPEAHNEMFRSVFPGLVPEVAPKWSLQAIVGTDPEIVVERDAPCTFHEHSGYIGEVPANTLPIDHTYGEPYFSIWGKRKNLVTHSTTLEDGIFIGGTTSIGEEQYSPKHEYDANIFCEDTDNITQEHGWKTHPIAFEVGKVYTSSIYVYPDHKHIFTISIPETLAGPNARIHVDITNPKNIFKPINHRSDINSLEVINLPNGWSRIIHSFRAQSTTVESIKFLFLDILDGDTTYIGDGEISGYLWQAQVEEGLNASPPIYTEEFVVERPATIAHIPFRNKFEPKLGTIVVEAKKPRNIKRNNVQYLYAIGDGIDTVTSGKFPTIRNQELYIESKNSFGDLLDYEWLGPKSSETIHTFVHSYNKKYHIYQDSKNYPVINSVSDTSITYVDVIKYILTNQYADIIASGNHTTMYDFQNTIKTTNSDAGTVNSSIIDENTIYIGDDSEYVDMESTDDPNENSELADFVLGEVYPSAQAFYSDNSVGTVDLVKGLETVELTVMLNKYEDLYIGSNVGGTEQLDGYIKSITYYQKSNNELEVEFLAGEYIHE
jgi:hypothetical protein